MPVRHYRSKQGLIPAGHKRPGANLQVKVSKPVIPLIGGYLTKNHDV